MNAIQEEVAETAERAVASLQARAAADSTVPSRAWRR